MENEKIENIKMKNIQKEAAFLHYYGDEVRTIFLVIAIVMIVMTPFVKNELPVPAYLSIFGVIVLSVLAGLTNPKLRFVIVFSFLASLASLVIFGYEVIVSSEKTYTSLFFGCNILLAILSLFALYFSSKTLRGHLLS